MHKILKFGKTDLVSAFHLLPVKVKHRELLLLKARHPITQVWYYFIDKCLPFGSAISCAHFQLFSDALAEILYRKYGIKSTNYLDDFLFISDDDRKCNAMVRKFLDLCEKLGVPVSKEKTEWTTSLITFLGILFDGSNHVLAVPEEKKHKAMSILKLVIDKKKVTVKVIQRLTGILNFLQRAIIPGRTFTRRMYDKLMIRNKQGDLLKQHHHVSVDLSFRNDCKMWITFLDNDHDRMRLCRPFVNLHAFEYAEILNFYTDASLNKNFGYGGVFADSWMYGKWGKQFIVEQEPSIEFLELYALCTGVMTWAN